jgi:hypothetical protein
VVCVRQSLMGAGRTDLPTDFVELTDGLPEGQWSREAFDAASGLADHLFGTFPREDGTHLFSVEDLTVKESAIPGRMDLTPAEKIERILPLRERRRAASEAAQPRAGRRPSKYELEYERHRGGRIAAAVTETTAVSTGDRTWAARFGLSFDQPGVFDTISQGRPLESVTKLFRLA